MTLYKKNLSEPWFSLIKLQIKTVEGRLNKEDVNRMKVGDLIEFSNHDFGLDRKILVRIDQINIYNSFRVYLEEETLAKCLPCIDNIEDGIHVYHKYYDPSDEIKYKIKSLTFTLLHKNDIL